MHAGAGAVQSMLSMLGTLQPLVTGILGSFRQLSLRHLALHKAVTKLGYIVTSLLSGVMQEGFCTAAESEEGAAGVLPRPRHLMQQSQVTEQQGSKAAVRQC